MKALILFATGVLSFGQVLAQAYDMVAAQNEIQWKYNISVSAPNYTSPYTVSLADERKFTQAFALALMENMSEACLLKIEVKVQPENVNPFDEATHYFGSDVAWSAHLLDAGGTDRNLGLVTVGHRSFDEAARQIAKACEFRKAKAVMFDAFDQAGITFRNSYASPIDINQSFAFIEALYKELRLDEHHRHSKHRVLVTMAQENGSIRSNQFSLTGPDIYEKRGYSSYEITVGDRSYAALAETLKNNYLE